MCIHMQGLFKDYRSSFITITKMELCKKDKLATEIKGYLHVPSSIRNKIFNSRNSSMINRGRARVKLYERMIQ